MLEGHGQHPSRGPLMASRWAPSSPPTASWRPPQGRLRGFRNTPGWSVPETPRSPRSGAWRLLYEGSLSHVYQSNGGVSTSSGTDGPQTALRTAYGCSKPGRPEHPETADPTSRVDRCSDAGRSPAIPQPPNRPAETGASRNPGCGRSRQHRHRGRTLPFQVSGRPTTTG